MTEVAEATGAVEAAVLAAIVDSFVIETDRGSVAVLPSTEIATALVNVLAAMLATAPDTATLAQRREVGARIGRQLTSRIGAFRDHVAARGAPFHTVNDQGGAPC